MVRNVAPGYHTRWAGSRSGNTQAARDGRLRENAPQWLVYAENSLPQSLVEYEVVSCPVTVCDVAAN